MIYPDNFETRIGFATVRNEISRRCQSAMGGEQCAAMHFSAELGEVTRWLRQTAEMAAIERGSQRLPLDQLHDLRAVLRSATPPGTFVTAENLHRLQGVLATIDEVRRFFKTSQPPRSPQAPQADEASEHAHPHLRQLAMSLDAFPELAGEIARILDKQGGVKDTASPLLSDLRRQIGSLQGSMSGIMRRVIAAGREAGYLDSDVQPAMRDGRLVIPVNPAHKRKVNGIVHDESATGKTVFIEPAELVEAGNRLREAEAEADREVVRILITVADLLRPDIDRLVAALDTLGTLDFIRAKALFAIDVDGQLPHIEKDPHIEWFHAVHPALLLALREQGKQVVPLNLELTGENRILLISGPNAGGKSVCLKTVGVVQYMLQCGVLPTMHDNSHAGLVDDIMVDIGDQQSIEDDLSTYSSHLQNMKTFLQRGGRRSLVLIDEMGSGTEPQIGGAIAQAILGQLNACGVTGVLTTHYQNLKQMADATPGIVNGAMLYDRQRLQPLFQLQMGYPGSSFAIEIARKTGLPAQIIDQAAEIAGSDYVNMDKYLLDIVRDRRYWERKRDEIHAKQKKLDSIIDDYNQRLERLSTQQREILKQARDEARDIVQQSNAQVERTIREIRAMQAEREKTKQVRQQLEEFKQRLENESEGGSPLLQDLKDRQPRRRQPKKKQAAPATAPADRPLAAGDHVVLRGSTTVGTVINVDEKYALVAFGHLKTRVETSRLERTLRKPERSQAPSVSRDTQAEIRARHLNFRPEIDVRGMRADEALQAVTYFIDDAIQFSAGRVRILHGTGTGALREAIRQYLNTVGGVRSFHDEHVQFGGAGITVVELE
ncbi:MAG: Smr/MutS family protein [Muribaculaceae bacterium]|nr:Smr/MutS family protein [Muribaculaceae bacterium]